MLKKFFLILTLILIPLTANAETYVDPKGRFQFEIPPGWTLATEKEKIEMKLVEPVDVILFNDSPNFIAPISITLTEDDSLPQIASATEAELKTYAGTWAQSLVKEDPNPLITSVKTPMGNGVAVFAGDDSFFYLFFRTSKNNKLIEVNQMTELGTSGANSKLIKEAFTKTIFSIEIF